MTPRTAVCFTVLFCCCSIATPCLARKQPQDLGRIAVPSPAVMKLQYWIAHTADNAGRPYVIIDKRAALLWIHDGHGAMIESAPVLLGSAKGDSSAPGIGEKPLASIHPDERTTPAGRFLMEAGSNRAGEDIFWLDYTAAVSLHRVRPVLAVQRRLHRLSTPDPRDNRITYGCVNLPIAVYNRSIHALFHKRGGIAYVLPETMDLYTAFPRLRPLALRLRPTKDPADPLKFNGNAAGYSTPVFLSAQ
ncbi:L,D-transpeptidase [Diaphorobacter ruginosibacter]|uniref:L,D-transpeptidase n=1 Tax=Diaphorobacter ruginosibacter TaxID=1715720 RepID=A0A7G9RJ60_9BURK|nr:L,D-transpeptidase [Diaphorobacter ruginosibacter]QNN55635.1 L,D-transpeptidase [Diaphorobacter ruginosibacter]